MVTPLTLNTDRGVDGTPRVIAAGEIDVSNIHAFTEALTAASEGNSRPITVDMSAVKYLDSAGINVLFKHADEIDRLHLIVHPFLMRVLSITGLSAIATVQPASAYGSGHGHQRLPAFEATQLDDPVRHGCDARNQQRHRHHRGGCHAEHPVQWHVHEQGHQEQNGAGGNQNAGTGHRSILLSVNASQGRPVTSRYLRMAAARCRVLAGAIDA